MNSYKIKKFFTVFSITIFLVSFNIAPASAASDGDLDTSFGTGGIVTTDIGSRDGLVESVVLQSDGKIVAAGYSHNGANYDFAVVRYNTDGSLDTTFGSGGKVSTDVGEDTETVASVALQSDGKIVAAGYSYNDSKNVFAVVRYNTDGSSDRTFGTGGIVVTPIGSGDSVPESVVVQSDGKIVVAGYSNNGSNEDFAIVRYNTDGSLDSTFGTEGTEGIVVAAIGSGDDYATSMVLQSDGKIVVAGY